mmetsp:Transcript_4372/g.11692  ORF Transcript_4372/g.11692 Transcript_4372/m.11692 type:complete len:392 (+) Transcript_4372:158-1333(+)
MLAMPLRIQSGRSRLTVLCHSTRWHLLTPELLRLLIQADASMGYVCHMLHFLLIFRRLALRLIRLLVLLRFRYVQLYAVGAQALFLEGCLLDRHGFRGALVIEAASLLRSPHPVQNAVDNGSRGVEPPALPLDQQPAARPVVLEGRVGLVVPHAQAALDGRLEHEAALRAVALRPHRDGGAPSHQLRQPADAVDQVHLVLRLDAREARVGRGGGLAVLKLAVEQDLLPLELRAASSAVLPPVMPQQVLDLGVLVGRDVLNPERSLHCAGQNHSAGGLVAEPDLQMSAPFHQARDLCHIAQPAQLRRRCVHESHFSVQDRLALFACMVALPRCPLQPTEARIIALDHGRQLLFNVEDEFLSELLADNVFHVTPDFVLKAVLKRDPMFLLGGL